MKIRPIMFLPFWQTTNAAELISIKLGADDDNDDDDDDDDSDNNNDNDSDDDSDDDDDGGDGGGNGGTIFFVGIPLKSLSGKNGSRNIFIWKVAPP